MSKMAPAAPHRDPSTVLEVLDLETQLVLDGRKMVAVNRISFNLQKGEILCIVGESGCGKSMLALSLLRLHPQPPARLSGGSVKLAGRELTTLPRSEMEAIRGARAAMIFQEPMTALNPIMTVGRQIGEVLRRHRNIRMSQARKQAVELLKRVNLPDPASQCRKYPFQLSGGMQQRVMIAMSMACNPLLLIADEPTTALDVTLQAQILELMRNLQREHSTALLFITHDLSVVAEMADRVLVMYAGHTMETADTESLFDLPAHPYTRALMASVPQAQKKVHSALQEIPGIVPPLWDLPPGCPFMPRCDRATRQCDLKPELNSISLHHSVACWHPHIK